MFHNAQNTLITGGSFNITNSFNTSDVPGSPNLDVLYMNVASNAILNAGGRADEVRCHPGTREEVIGRIEEWGDMQCQKAPILWLSGPAGAGKSAIMQTIAERCDQRGVPHANFFFFRADNSRNHASPLVATLVHQLILLYPSLRDSVATALSANPLIFASVLDNQLTRLIVPSLRAIKQSSSAYCPLILLVDGLDECDSERKLSQQQILRAFDKVLVENPCLFRLLVASRDESQIRTAFNKMNSQCVHLYLNDKYFPEKDIWVFVNAQFDQVKRAHPLAHTLHSTWPLAEDIKYIVEKSSGQFIYAATVMRFISDSSASPAVSLDRVKGAAQLATTSPFSHLDAIYTYILSQADDQKALKDILHAQSSMDQVSNITIRVLWPNIPSGNLTLVNLLGLINRRYTDAILVSCLADLTPIARYTSHSSELLYYHASFSDYLLDRSRSRDYFVDMAEFNYKILPVVWKFLQNEQPENDQSWLQFGLCGITHLRKIPPQLMNMLAVTNFQNSHDYLPGKGLVFQIIHNLCTSDNDIKHFRRTIYHWIYSRNVKGHVFDNLKFDDIKDTPFGPRYYHMARANRYYALDDEMSAALRPETDFDRQELSSWLKDLISSSYRKIGSRDRDLYAQIVQAWISWAIENEIPCDVLRGLPGARQYFPRRTMQTRFAELFLFRIGCPRK